MKKILSMIALVSALGFSGLALAEEEVVIVDEAVSTEIAPAAAEAVDTATEAMLALSPGDTAWTIVATVLVLAMIIPGVALFYGGLVRTKNMVSILTQVFVTTALMSVIWVVYGYSLAFTDGGSLNAYIGGFSKTLLSGITPDTLLEGGTIPEYVFVTFQLTFAAITPALIVGGFAERMKFSAVLAFLALWVTFIYIPIAHMVWGGGFLGDLGAADFAGGTVVHMNAGIAALVGAIVVGKRLGYGKEAMPPHSITLTMVGASMLWVGWFGFNVGSELAADGIAGLALINTQAATGAAVLGWVFAEWLFKGKPSLLGAVSGAVAGLVAITPACGFLGPVGAIVLGFVASVIAFWAVTSLKVKLGYDDSLDVFGIHGVAGLIGAFGTGILMSADFGGIGYEEGTTMASQLYAQAVAIGVTIVWGGIGSYILFKIVDLFIGLRASEEAEREGLDTSEHGERAYHY
ncbi:MULTISPECIES: ammonium transporter [Methylobacillus]|uniref:Ammonium transporter n=1 Tax=Methylobacillus flagellatus (strain ATCC 51484 / DSM 6875 / VKM B-1610 / KT) TaxID=265072 RepID=Q1GYA8_METFK|nr:MULTISPECIES: ammonium transporter [Methylobacillus]ABE50779.1 ammonium transporter [Methylobacillus flagellatus KT]MPS47618.1 ammonium transporter [Methylobacillus sp.]